MPFDNHINFGYSLVSVAPAPAAAGTSITVTTGTGVLFPAPPFNCTIWPTGVIPISSNAEIIRVTNIVGDVLTIDRAQEGTVARSIVIGDQIANSISVKVLTDIETDITSAESDITSIQGDVASVISDIDTLTTEVAGKQSADPQLDTWSGITPDSAVATWIATPTLANLSAAVNDANIARTDAGNSFIDLQTVTKNGIGVATTNGFLLQNQTDAASGAGNQQYSPTWTLGGVGYGSVSGVNTPVLFKFTVEPVTGGVSPTGNLKIRGKIGAGADFVALTLSEIGTLTIPGNLVVGTNGLYQSSRITLSNQIGVSEIRLTFSANGIAILDSAVGGNFSRLVLGPSAANATWPALLPEKTLSSTGTATLANPCVWTVSGHGLAVGNVVRLSTNGTLPTGFTAGTNYYVTATSLASTTFTLSATLGGSAISSLSGSQSGAHTVTTQATIHHTTGDATAYVLSISKGTVVADEAPVNTLGEYTSSLVASGSAVGLTTATPVNVTSISLTAGDWDVEGNINFALSAATATQKVGAIHTTSATLPTDGSEVNNGVQSTLLSANDGLTLPRKRVSVSTTTTVYLVAQATFSAGTVGAFGGITARRVR